MRRRKKINKKAKNKKVEQISRLLLECNTWALLNIKMLLNGYTLDEDVILILIHFSFLEHKYNVYYTDADWEMKHTMQANAQQILMQICNNQDVELNDNMISIILKKVIFSNATQQFTKDQLHEMLLALVHRNASAVKVAYAQYSTFAKYKV